MTFDLGGAVNSMSEWLCGSALVKAVVSNPVYTALLLTTIVVVIILSMYYKEFKRGGTKKVVRMTIYLLLAVAAMIFIHHYAVERAARTTIANEGVREVFRGIAQSREINPTTISTLGTTGAATGGASAVAPQAATDARAETHQRQDNVGDVALDEIADIEV